MNVRDGNGKNKSSEADGARPTHHIACVLCREPAELVGHVGKRPRYRCTECGLYQDRPFDSAEADAGRTGGDA